MSDKIEKKMLKKKEDSKLQELNVSEIDITNNDAKKIDFDLHIWKKSSIFVVEKSLGIRLTSEKWLNVR